MDKNSNSNFFCKYFFLLILFCFDMNLWQLYLFDEIKSGGIFKPKLIGLVQNQPLFFGAAIC